MRYTATVSTLGLALLAGCGNLTSPLAAVTENRIDDITLYDVNASRLDQPSGYLMFSRRTILIGVEPPLLGSTGVPFDFLYRVDPIEGPQLVPFGGVAPIPSTSTNTRPAF